MRRLICIVCLTVFIGCGDQPSHDPPESQLGTELQGKKLEVSLQVIVAASSSEPDWIQYAQVIIGPGNAERARERYDSADGIRLYRNGTLEVRMAGRASKSFQVDLARAAEIFRTVDDANLYAHSGSYEIVEDKTMSNDSFTESFLWKLGDQIGNINPGRPGNRVKIVSYVSVQLLKLRSDFGIQECAPGTMWGGIY